MTYIYRQRDRKTDWQAGRETGRVKMGREPRNHWNSCYTEVQLKCLQKYEKIDLKYVTSR